MPPSIHSMWPARATSARASPRIPARRPPPGQAARGAVAFFPIIKHEDTCTPRITCIPETTHFGRTPLFLVPISTTDRTHAPFSLLQYMTDSLRRFHLRFEIKFRGGGALVASHFTGGSGTAYPGSPLLGAPRRADRCRRRHCTRTARRGWRRDARPRAQAEDAP